MKGPIDLVQEQWRAQRPDLDLSPIGVLGRARRVARLADTRSKSVLRRLGLRSWEYEMLAVLRRTGPDGGITPTALGDALLVSSGTLTNRIDQLERAGWVERTDHPGDRRAFLIALTPDGRAQIDRAVSVYLDEERALLDALTKREQRSLEGLLRKLLVSLDTSGAA